MSERLTGTIGFFAGLPGTLGSMVVHIVACVSANWAAMLIIGLVVPPVGMVHGTGILLGVVGMSRYEIAAVNRPQSVAFGWDARWASSSFSVLALPQGSERRRDGGDRGLDGAHHLQRLGAHRSRPSLWRHGPRPILLGEGSPTPLTRLCSDAGISNRYTPKAHEYARVRAKREGAPAMSLDPSVRAVLSRNVLSDGRSPSTPPPPPPPPRPDGYRGVQRFDIGPLGAIVRPKTATAAPRAAPPGAGWGYALLICRGRAVSSAPFLGLRASGRRRLVAPCHGRPASRTRTVSDLPHASSFLVTRIGSTPATGDHIVDPLGLQGRGRLRPSARFTVGDGCAKPHSSMCCIGAAETLMTLDEWRGRGEAGVAQ